MWKWTGKDETKLAPPSGVSRAPSATPPLLGVPSREAVQRVLTPHSAQGPRTNVTHIGKSIVIKGELSGSGDVYLDGELEGSVELLDGSLTVGPDGRIRANLRAHNIVVRGRVDGNLYGTERVALKELAIFVGDIYTDRIAIEDGADLKGNVRGRKESASPQAKTEDGTADSNSSEPSSARREDW